MMQILPQYAKYTKIFSGIDFFIILPIFLAWKPNLADLYLVSRVFSRVLLIDGNHISILPVLWQGDCLQQQLTHLANSFTISPLSSFKTLGWMPSGPSDLFMSNLSTRLGTPSVLLTFWSITSDLYNSNFPSFSLISILLDLFYCSKYHHAKISFPISRMLLKILYRVIFHFCYSNCMAKWSISFLLFKLLG